VKALAALLLLAAPAAGQQVPHASPGADTGLRGRYDSGNPFARTIRGELPAKEFIVHEDSRVLVLVPLTMARPGHLLVIPKRLGARNLLDLTPAELRACMVTVQQAARAQIAALGATGFQVRQNNGLTGGQTVFHPHFHVIPAFASRDEPLRSEGEQDSPAVRAAMAARLRAAWPKR
jgi:histidine triad (HIT) family protein